MNNPLKKVYLSQANLNTIANGGSITSGDDSYSADMNAIYMIPDDSNVVQTTGQSTTDIMSQKATTDALGDKADKVSDATAGNFAGLDANGNLTDSGKKASDFAPSETWKLIEDYTSTEDAAFVRTQWSDNGTTKNYNFKKLKISIRVPTLSANYNTYFKCYMDRDREESALQTYLPNLGKTNTSTTALIDADANKDCKTPSYFVSVTSASTRNVYAGFLSDINYTTNIPSWWYGYTGYFKKIALGSTNSPVPTGTHIIIYGVEGE